MCLLARFVAVRPDSSCTMIRACVNDAYVLTDRLGGGSGRGGRTRSKASILNRKQLFHAYNVCCCATLSASRDRHVTIIASTRIKISLRARRVPAD